MIVKPSRNRRSLASFDNAYAVAVQLRESTDIPQIVVETGDPAQPYRVHRREPAPSETVIALIS